VKLSLLAGGLGNNLGAILGAVVVVFFLEATRFVVPLVPGISAVQGAALREILISVALLLILRVHARGLLPERIPNITLPERPVPPRLTQSGNI
jgi:branched-chain amino acid transport system permease protein